MKEALEHGLKQFAPIVISGLLAGLVAFAQSLASTHGYCSAPPATTETAGALGMALKAVHTIAKLPKLV